MQRVLLNSNDSVSATNLVRRPAQSRTGLISKRLFEIKNTQRECLRSFQSMLVIIRRGCSGFAVPGRQVISEFLEGRSRGCSLVPVYHSLWVQPCERPVKTRLREVEASSAKAFDVYLICPIARHRPAAVSRQRVWRQGLAAGRAKTHEPCRSKPRCQKSPLQSDLLPVRSSLTLRTRLKRAARERVPNRCKIMKKIVRNKRKIKVAKLCLPGPPQKRLAGVAAMESTSGLGCVRLFSHKRENQTSLSLSVLACCLHSSKAHAGSDSPSK